MAPGPEDAKAFIQRYFPNLSGVESEQLEKMVAELGASPDELAELSTVVEQMEKMFESDEMPEEFADILNQTLSADPKELFGGSPEELASGFASMLAEMPPDLKAQMSQAFEELGMPNLDSFLEEAASLSAPAPASSEPAVVDAEKDFLSPLRNR